jgi:DNA polymerase I-like protein with 3'-5' exonuclease and polymerase domains
MEGLILTEKDLREQVEYFLKQDAFVWDVETMDGTYPETRGVPTHNRVVWLSMATHGRSIIIPMGHPNGDVVVRKSYRKLDKETRKFTQFPNIYNEPPMQLKPSVVFDILRPLFFHPKIIKIAHNTVFDAGSIYKYYGEYPVGPFCDTLVLQQLLDENILSKEFPGGPKRPMKLGLKTLVEWYYQVKYDKEEVGKCIELHPFNKVARYGLLDAVYTWSLWLMFVEMCELDNLSSVRALEESLIPALIPMNIVGAPVDLEALVELKDYLSVELEKLEAAVYKAAKKIFNMNSPRQKQDILYGFKKDGGQGLKPWKLTKGGAIKKKNKQTLTIYDYSTDEEALKNFLDNPVVEALDNYSEVHKLLGTYVISYLGDPDDPKKPTRLFEGRIHASLDQAGTVTGRFSCRSPNLQNIPRPDTELGKKVRGLFRAPKGYKLVVADYGQMELRILASYIGFGGLFDGFQAGIDAHTQTAALVYNVPVDKVEKWMRTNAKTLNFAIVYGAFEDKVAKTLKVSIEEARILLEDHRKAFPEIYAFKDAVIHRAKSRKIPHITTILGRKRRLWNLTSDNWKSRSSAERQAVNSLIQGSLGDIIKLAMVRMHRLLSEDAVNNPGQEIYMILSIHDELVLLCPEHRSEDASNMLKEAMLGSEIQNLIKVPLDIGEPVIVSRWSDAKE